MGWSMAWVNPSQPCRAHPNRTRIDLQLLRRPTGGRLGRWRLEAHQAAESLGLTSRHWFIKQRWPAGVCCPYCGSLNVQIGCQHKTMPFRCREKACGRKRFSVRTGTVMECSKIGYQDWMLAMFLVMTNLKGVSSMKLHRDSEINQRSAWFLAHRLRLALTERVGPFSGPVEADETYLGGKRRNMSNAQRKELVWWQRPTRRRCKGS